MSNVTCHYLPALNTIEMDKIRIIEKKRRVVDAATGSNTTTDINVENDMIASVFGDI